MPEQIFKSPGFYDREIDLTTRSVQPSGIPAGVIGAAQKGRAFVPVTVGSFDDFQVKFGNTDTKYPASYGVQKFLDSKFSCTFVRVLGAGSNTNQTDIDNTRNKKVFVKNAGVQAQRFCCKRYRP
ncbi:MAG: hypothetical protein HC899_39250 [Leptolyngbyaceae cyanobacterium SM1_4_3]|nr:hypothetical protein [Leptolyngbyaceae cyanobacterium SM1_4_3]